MFICTLLTIRRLELRDPAHWTLTSSARKKPVRISYDPPSNDVSNNTFLATFERLMGSADLSYPCYSLQCSYVPLIVQHDGRILCRGSHKDALSKARVKHYIEMLSVGRRIEREKGSDTRMNYPVGLRTRNDRFKPRERERESDGGHGILPVILVGSDNADARTLAASTMPDFPVWPGTYHLQNTATVGARRWAWWDTRPGKCLNSVTTLGIGRSSGTIGGTHGLPKSTRRSGGDQRLGYLIRSTNCRGPSW